MKWFRTRLLVLCLGLCVCMNGCASASNSDEIQVASGSDATYLIDSQSRLWAYGYTYRTTELVPLLEDIQKVSVSGLNAKDNVLVLKKGGALLQLKGPDSEPTPLMEGVRDMVATVSGYLAVKQNGEVYSFKNGLTQVVGASTVVLDNEPYLVLKNCKSVYYTYDEQYGALTTEGDLYCWGDVFNEYQSEPLKVADGIRDLVFGRTIFLTDKDNTLWGLGYNGAGQLGNGDSFQNVMMNMQALFIKEPLKISEKVKCFTANGSTLCFIKNDNSLWGCGFNDYGQLGTKDTGYSAYRCITEPVLIQQGADRVFMGSSAVFFTKDNALWACGSNLNGQLGIGTPYEQLNKNQFPLSSTPQKVLEGPVKSLLAGNRIHCLMADGSLKVWGYDPLYLDRNGLGSNITYTEKVRHLVNEFNFLNAPAEFPLPADFGF